MVIVLLLVLLLAGCSNSPTSPTTTPPPVSTTPTTPVVTTPPVTVTPTNPYLIDPRFNAAFFLQFVSATPSRWMQAPRVYLRTVDDAGSAIPAALLDQTAAAIINTASQWTGGAFGVAGLERGTETRRGQFGWITVAWGALPNFCGMTNVTTIGFDGGITSNIITMNHTVPACTCGPLVMKHELGHALGYKHTDSTADVMSGEPVDGRVCDKPLSAREAFHARAAYWTP